MGGGITGMCNGVTPVSEAFARLRSAPLFCFCLSPRWPLPLYHLKVLGLLEGKSTADIRDQLDQDYKSTMLANWGVFVPAATVNLAFCPPELRVLFLNVSHSYIPPHLLLNVGHK